LCVVGIFLLQTLVYLGYCWRILARRSTQNLALFSRIDDPSLNTLRILIVAVIANYLVSALRVLNCITPGDDGALGALFAGSQTLIIAYVIVAVFKQETQFREVDQALRESISTSKYEHSALSDAHRDSIQAKLTAVMQGGRLYEDNDLNLPALCEHINENPHQVSQVINESDYCNFYDFVNRHRVEAAKQRLIERPEQSVLDVAFAVGFNSKSTFNAAFKRYAQATPTQYRCTKLTQKAS